jgi:hypothetical protein
MVDNNKNKQNNAKQEKTFWKLTRNQWGWVSTITNGLSVLFQLYSLYSTYSAESFSMNFIWIMILLNFVYFLVAIIQNNTGFMLATLFFVIYNLCVVYVHHCGEGGYKLKGWFHRQITRVCTPQVY